LAEGFTLHIAPTTTNYEKLFNLTKAHLGLISQILLENCENKVLAGDYIRKLSIVLLFRISFRMAKKIGGQRRNYITKLA